MPPPFPGMDPYLENPMVWPGFHLGLIADLQSVLNRQLRPKYVARVEERVYISDENDTGRSVIVPDLRVLAHDHLGEMHAGEITTHAATGVIEPVEVTTFIEDEIREARIEVIDTEFRSGCHGD